MDHSDLIKRGKGLLGDLTAVIEKLSDEEVRALFDSGEIEAFLKAVLDPATVKNYRNYGEFFLANKHRAWFLAGLRMLVTLAYSFKGRSKSGAQGYVAPFHAQWYDDGVMLLEGRERFTGAIELYVKGEARYAVAARDIKPGAEIGPDDMTFVSLDQYLRARHSGLLPGDAGLDAPAKKLRQLLSDEVDAEAKYQELLEAYPWIMGILYRKFGRHTILDNKNIPDFTGVRVADGHRDLFELKSPFLRLTRENGEWSSAFYDAWQQAEDRIDFVERESAYLYREKGLTFENPKCHLILGYGLDNETEKRLYAKARSNPKILVHTYDHLLSYVESTILTVRTLQQQTGEDAV